MSYIFDFGFEVLGTDWDDARLAFLFATVGEEEDFGKASGPLAVADASRYAEFFEMQEGLLPLETGVFAEILGGSDPLTSAVNRAQEASEKGIIPIIIGNDRRVTTQFCSGPLVALWGKLGRAEADEPAIFFERETVIAGVRAATSNAFKAVPGYVAIVTACAVGSEKELFEAALDNTTGPVHLSIDLDVLTPSVCQTLRSIEPGGITWYDLIDVIEMVFAGPGVASADLVGTEEIQPRSPTALLCAQILLKIAGLAAAGSKI